MNEVLELFDTVQAFRPLNPDPPQIQAPAEPQVAVYMRVSTEDQNTDLQRSELLAQAKFRGWEPIIYEDQGISGANFDRPALNRLLADADAGRIKVIMAWKLDRIGRSTQHLAGIINRLLKAEVGLVVPSQGIDTSAGSMNPASKLQLNVLAAVAEFERDLIRERTKAGMKVAKDRGIHCGRPSVVRGEKREFAKALLAQHPEMGVRELARHLGINPATAMRLKNKLLPILEKEEEKP
jgi:DNA invertase Pin-like site-specific DNA recombinase